MHKRSVSGGLEFSIHHCGHLNLHGRVCSLGVGIGNGKELLLGTGIINAPIVVPIEFVESSIVAVEYLRKYTI